jgi:hypothetical protein
MTRRILLLTLCLSLASLTGAAFAAQGIGFEWTSPPDDQPKGQAFTPSVTITNIPGAAEVTSATIIIYNNNGVAVQTITATTITQTQGSNTATVSGSANAINTAGAYTIKIKVWVSNHPTTQNPDYTSMPYSFNVN